MARLVFRAAGPVRLAPALRAAFLLDALLSLAYAAWGVLGLLGAGEPAFPTIRAAYGLLALPAAILGAAGRVRARVWRRRAMLAAIVAVFVAGRPAPTLEAGLVVLWHGGLLIAQLIAGRETSRAVSAVTGEEGLPDA